MAWEDHGPLKGSTHTHPWAAHGKPHLPSQGFRLSQVPCHLSLQKNNLKTRSFFKFSICYVTGTYITLLEKIPFTTFFQIAIFFPFYFALTATSEKKTEEKSLKQNCNQFRLWKAEKKPTVMRCHQFCFYGPLHFTHSFHFIFLCWYLVVCCFEMV